MEIVAAVLNMVGLYGGVKGLWDLIRGLCKRRRERKRREEEIALMRAWVDAMGKVKTRPFICC